MEKTLSFRCYVYGVHCKKYQRIWNHINIYFTGYDSLITTIIYCNDKKDVNYVKINVRFLHYRNICSFHVSASILCGKNVSFSLFIWMKTRIIDYIALAKKVYITCFRSTSVFDFSFPRRRRAVLSVATPTCNLKLSECLLHAVLKRWQHWQYRWNSWKLLFQFSAKIVYRKFRWIHY